MEALTNISAFGRDKPSFFELVAQESMEELLRPCIAYLLNVIAQKYPNQRTISLVSWQDEIFASVASLLNFLYLRYTSKWVND